jgi:segregation and condensation protein A
MKNLDQDTFALDNFEGPLDFLIHLIQKNEIDICDIPLQRITEQYLLKILEGHSTVSTGAEFVGTTASLLWLKSKMLLPKHEQIQDPDQELLDNRFDMIRQLIDYCCFKQAAKELSEREHKQSGYYLRGADGEAKKTLGIEHLTLDDLASLFQQVVAKAATHTGLIHEENWKVSDKISLVRDLLDDEQKIDFLLLFASDKSRDELIVTFLAILELMKLGEICIIKSRPEESITIVKNGQRD